jgi:hypothetical protein
MREVTRVLCVLLACGSAAASAVELTPFPKSQGAPDANESAVAQFKAAIQAFSCPQLAETNQAIAAKAAAATTPQDKAYYTRLIGVVAEANFTHGCAHP